MRSRRPRLAHAAREALAAVGLIDLLPVTLRFWDGSVLEGGSPVIEIRSPGAIAHLIHAPNQIGLARAWVRPAWSASRRRCIRGAGSKSS